MVMLTAKRTAREKVGDVESVQHLVNLILKPGLWFGGIKFSGGDAGMEEEREELLEDGLAARMSQISM